MNSILYLKNCTLYKNNSAFETKISTLQLKNCSLEKSISELKENNHFLEESNSKTSGLTQQYSALQKDASVAEIRNWEEETDKSSGEEIRSASVERNLVLYQINTVYLN